MEYFDELVQVIRQLREKCPWDSVQTHESMMFCITNEAQEVIEGIEHFKKTGDAENLCEELGDVLMQVILHSIIAEEEGVFTLEDVINGIREKMIFRHPHIFAPDDEEMNELSWKELKKLEKERKKKKVNNAK